MAFVGGWGSSVVWSRSLRNKGICWKRNVLPIGRGVVRMGLLDALKKGVGLSVDDDGRNVLEGSEEMVEKYRRRVESINGYEKKVEEMSDEDIQNVIKELRRDDRDVTDVLEGGEDELYALLREAGWRAWGLRAFDVQMIGVLCLRDGKLAEMATGEGKTLVAAIAAVMESLITGGEGRGVLIVTVNDYLAQRDALFTRRLGRVLGMNSIGVVLGAMDGKDRRRAYSSDVCYVTNSELGFDYLRDNLALVPEDVVISKPFGFCIVDEADSILIDEARTPLIITEKMDAPIAQYTNATKIANYLKPKKHYIVKEKEQMVLLTDRGYEDCEQILKVDDLFDPVNPWALKITNAIKAKELFRKNKEYIVRDNTIQIVDEFTGRVMEGRRWSDGLHQAIEAKESIPIMNETITTASISYQAFFKLFPKLAGMTGTAATEANELIESYDLQTVVIPTALPVARRDHPDSIYISTRGKLKALVDEVKLIHDAERPILIGTTSVADSEKLSSMLAEADLPHRVLNARPEVVAQESEIVAQAGCKSAITIATNMAGRGTDILLGGNADFMTREIARLAFSEDSREEKKVRFVSRGVVEILIPDEIQRELTMTAEHVLSACKACGFRVDDPRLIERIIFSAADSMPLRDIQEVRTGEKSVAGLQKQLAKLGTIMDRIEEGFAGPVVRKAREEIISLGGLYVFGTERHESRRIDDQLRGRCGRQGDPGTTKFFLSLQDNLFSTFARERMEKMLKSFRVKEDMDIANPLVQKALDNAQVKVEEYFREIRDNLFKYDSIMSAQREAVYRGRRKALFATDIEIRGIIEECCKETAREIVDAFAGASRTNFEGLEEKLKQYFAGIKEVDRKTLHAHQDNLMEYVEQCLSEALSAKIQETESQSSSPPGFIMRYLTLIQTDIAWKSHLRGMNYVKDFIALKAYREENPLDEYERQGFQLFNDMMASIRRNTVYSFFQHLIREQEKTAAY